MTTMLVVDASVAVKWLVAEQGSVEAAAILATAEALIAPDWILPEAANALWNKLKRGEIQERAVIDGLEALPSFFQRLYVTADLLSATYALMLRLKHAPYDCFYLALAVQHEAVLITADQIFYRACLVAGENAHVRLLEWDR